MWARVSRVKNENRRKASGWPWQGSEKQGFSFSSLPDKETERAPSASEKAMAALEDFSGGPYQELPSALKRHRLM